MSSHSPAPALIFPGQSAQLLVQLSKVHSKFDEHFLQELLAKNPELLPAASIRPDVGSLLCVGREVAVPGGFIDNLYLSTAGYPVLVETKLWRNPEARRAVLTQTLEYVKDLTRLDFQWFQEQWAIRRVGTAYQGASLIERISELAQDEIDEGRFIDRVNGALGRGDILAMIVGDGIETRLQELVAHLCQDSAHLRYALTLCELSFFELGAEESDGMLVVPRIVSNVEPVQRAYVEVAVAQELAGKVVVTSKSVPEDRPVRANLNEEEFLQSVEASVGTEMRKHFEDAYNDLITSFELEPDFKAAALMLKIPDPEDRRPGASVLGFQKNGKIYNTAHLAGQLRRWEGLSEETVKDITTNFWATLNKIDSRFSVGGLSHMAPKQFIPFAEVQRKWPEIKDAVGAITAKVRAEVDAAEQAG